VWHKLLVHGSFRVLAGISPLRALCVRLFLIKFHATRLFGELFRPARALQDDFYRDGDPSA